MDKNKNTKKLIHSHSQFNVIYTESITNNSIIRNEINRIETPRDRFVIKSKLDHLRYGKRMTFTKRKSVRKSQFFHTGKRLLYARKAYKKWRKTAMKKNGLHRHTHSHHCLLLQSSVRMGRINQIAKILKYCEQFCDGFDLETTLNQRARSGLPLIITAIQEGHIETVRYLIQLGCKVDVNSGSPNFRPAIMYAVVQSSLNMVELLVENGAMFTERDIKLLRTKDRDFRFKQLRNEAQLIKYINRIWSKRLIKAVQLDDTKSVLVMLALNERSKILHAKDINRSSSIHIACQHGNAKIARLLLQHTPKLINATDGTGLLPLQIAFISRNFKLADVLIKEYGARLTLKQLKKVLDLYKPKKETDCFRQVELFARLICQSIKVKYGKQVLVELQHRLQLIRGLSLYQIKTILKSIRFDSNDNQPVITKPVNSLSKQLMFRMGNTTFANAASTLLSQRSSIHSMSVPNLNKVRTRNQSMRSTVHRKKTLKSIGEHNVLEKKLPSIKSAKSRRFVKSKSMKELTESHLTAAANAQANKLESMHKAIDNRKILFVHKLEKIMEQSQSVTRQVQLFKLNKNIAAKWKTRTMF